MHRVAFALALGLLVGGCRELTSPKTGYIKVANIATPIVIAVKEAEGPGYVDALKPDGQWERVYQASTEGSFLFGSPLPAKVWHCNESLDDCVAVLKVGDSKGVFGTPHDGRIYVCTDGYKQTMGRKHCGERALQIVLGTGQDVELPHATSKFFQDVNGESTPAYLWKGDPTSRIFYGDQWFPEMDTHSPPPDDRYTRPTSNWIEVAYSPDEELIVGGTPVLASIDTGACSIFVPWEWKNRIQDPLWTPIIGTKTGNRGFAEILLDGMIENWQPTENIMRDAFLYMDAITNVWMRDDASPEFHVRVSNNVNGNDFESKTQMCLKIYLNANNQISEGIDGWYRWDQGILSALTSIFNIGDCKTHPASVFYCGTIETDTQGKPYFNIAKDVHVNIQDYSVFKPACNNQFIPQFKSGIQEGIRTEGAQNLTDGIRDFTTALGKLGINPRRFELTPTGIYIVTAYSALDPQYGIGQCLPDIEHHPDETPYVQPSITQSYPATGVTRF
ncbi:MAG: hypothetical protein PVH21_08915 [Myxococcales bacterium]|jgi:hypothetical protein